jgi:hypothetical protein
VVACCAARSGEIASEQLKTENRKGAPFIVFHPFSCNRIGPTWISPIIKSYAAQDDLELAVLGRYGFLVLGLERSILKPQLTPRAYAAILKLGLLVATQLQLAIPDQLALRTIFATSFHYHLA